jgi:hypothetical protein
MPSLRLSGKSNYASWQAAIETERKAEFIQQILFCVLRGCCGGLPHFGVTGIAPIPAISKSKNSNHVVAWSRTFSAVAV